MKGAAVGLRPVLCGLSVNVGGSAAAGGGMVGASLRHLPISRRRGMCCIARHMLAAIIIRRATHPGDYHPRLPIHARLRRAPARERAASPFPISHSPFLITLLAAM